jgi:short-subunit dehydrogenase
MVSVLTGASAGIGEATARLFAERHGQTLVLVARREDRLRDLAASIGNGATYVACDITDDDAPERIRSHVAEHHGGQLNVLVNNAGAAWRGTFAETGWANVKRHMELNFDAQLRVTEALLPLLRETAPSAIVNVSSTAGRIGRAGSGAYSSAKFAFTGWTDALYQEEKPNGVHVGLVEPGFISTEGFPQSELTESWKTRWIVSTPEKGAEAIADCAFNGKAERYVPKAYNLVPVLRTLTPWLVRGAGGGPLAKRLATKTNAK